MLQIILLIIGIVALFKESIDVTKKSELRQPNLRKFGIITVAMFVLVVISNMTLPENSDVSLLIYFLSYIVPIVVAVKLRQPKETKSAGGDK